MQAKSKPSEDPLESLRALLDNLDLTTLAREIPELLRQAETAAPSYSDFLRLALSVEQAARTQRKIERGLRMSHLGPGPDTLDGFDFAARPQLSPQAVRELLTGRFVEEKRNVILVGRPSTGKTTVAQAIGRAACRRGFCVYYTPLVELLESIYAARLDGTYRKVLKRLLRPDLLILDDAGFSTLSPDNATELFRLVAARHQKCSSLVVTNLPFRQWGEFIPSPAQAVAIADRLVDNATILRFSGKPFRVPKDVYGAPLDGE